MILSNCQVINDMKVLSQQVQLSTDKDIVYWTIKVDEDFEGTDDLAINLYCNGDRIMSFIKQELKSGKEDTIKFHPTTKEGAYQLQYVSKTVPIKGKITSFLKVEE